MTNNIEQRTNVAVSKIEGAGTTMDLLAHTDDVVDTPAGKRQSFPKLSREFEADNYRREGEHISAQNQREQDFQDRFSTAQSVIEWAPGISVSDKFQRYSVGTIGNTDYAEYLPNPKKIPFQTGNSITDDIATGLWLENGVPNQSEVERKGNEAQSQLIKAKVWPDELTRNARVGDVLDFNCKALRIAGTVYTLGEEALAGRTITSLSISPVAVSIDGIPQSLGGTLDESLVKVRGGSRPLPIADIVPDTMRCWAAGDGESDDSDGYQQGTKSLRAPDRFRLDKPVSSNPSGIISNHIAQPTHSNGVMIDYCAPVIANTITTLAVKTFTDVVEVSDATNIRPGNVVKIKSNTPWPFWVDCYYGHVATVERVIGNRVYLEQPFLFSFAAGAQVTVYLGGTLILDRYHVKSILNQAGSRAKALRIMGYSHVEIEQGIAEHGNAVGLMVAYCTNVWSVGGEYRYANSTMEGYGLQIYGCNEVDITGIHGHGCRRLVDISGDIPTASASIRHFRVHGGGLQEDGEGYFPNGSVPNYGVGSHGGAISLDISDGYLCNLAHGVNLRGVKTTLRDLTFDGAMGHQLIALADGTDLFVDGITYRPFGRGYQTETINDYRSLLPSNFLTVSEKAAAMGGKISVKNTDVHIQENFVSASSRIQGRVELTNVSAKFDKLGGGQAYWVKGDFDDLSIGEKTTELSEGTYVALSNSSTSFTSGRVDTTEGYTLEVDSEKVSTMQMDNSDSYQFIFTVTAKNNPDIRGIVVLRRNSNHMHDLGVSSKLASMSGVLTDGAGEEGYVTFSIQPGGVLQVSNRTGAKVLLSIKIQAA